MASSISIGKLKYAGKGQIVLEKTGQLVSPRGVVSAYNDLLEITEDFRRTLNKALDALVARGIEVGDGE